MYGGPVPPARGISCLVLQFTVNFLHQVSEAALVSPSEDIYGGPARWRKPQLLDN